MIVDGKKIAGEIVGALAARRALLPEVLKLGVLMGATDGAAASFVKIKERVADRLQVVVVREVLDEHSTQAHALRALGRLAATCDGVIVQLPLPAGLDTDALLATIPPEKDADAIGEHARLLAPVAGAIAELFSHHNVVASGKKAVVVGAGRLVGAPAAALLRDVGAHVSVITRGGSLDDLKEADIAVLGAGEPGLVSPEMLKEGVVLIDAGTSDANDSGSAIAGDADPRCAQVASIFTPVPGGVGPIAVAMLFKNLFDLAQK